MWLAGSTTNLLCIKGVVKLAAATYHCYVSKMRLLTNPSVVYPVLFAAVYAFVALPALGSGLPAGKPTADEAASPSLSTTGGADLHGWSYGYALGDTTIYDFPEEDEKSTLQLVKEVTLWLVIAGFVGFFIVKVFLEGDKEQPPPDNPGKPVPTPSTVIAPQPDGAQP
jgi:hypothetical protein